MDTASEGRGIRLYHEGPASGARAPILVTHFDGAMDAGAAGGLAIEQMVHSLGSQRVATFDSDLLIDYRSHRPIMSVEDWVTTDMEMPEIALDLVHDDLGHPILLLHGPEPDARWESFGDAVTALARAAGVEVSFALYGIPAGVPHTRPTPVHVQATDSSLVPEQPQMSGTMQFPAPVSGYLQDRLAGEGIDGATLIAAVPYYMAENAYPRAASALLTRLSEFGGLSLPVGDLEHGAAQEMEQVKPLIAGNPDVSRTVEALEHHFDALQNGGDATSTPSLPEGVWDESDPEDIGDVIEAYLANRDRRERESDGDQTDDETVAETGDTGDDGGPRGGSGSEDRSQRFVDPSGPLARGPRPETLEDVLRRLRGGDASAGGAPRRARHRAENPWDRPGPEEEDAGSDAD